MSVTTKEIEFAIAKYYNPRLCNIIPNVSWGAGLEHECDLLVVKRSKWAIEIEIKVSKSDMKADLKKEHQHKHEMISQLYYAMPIDVYEQCKDIIPSHAGVYVISDYLSVKCIREAEKNKDSRKITDEELTNILRLGNMRTWSLREKILQKEGKISKPKRTTKRERYDKEMLLDLLNVRTFLQRGHYKDPDKLRLKMMQIDQTIEKFQAKKQQQ